MALERSSYIANDEQLKDIEKSINYCLLNKSKITATIFEKTISTEVLTAFKASK